MKCDKFKAKNFAYIIYGNYFKSKQYFSFYSSAVQHKIKSLMN